MDFITGLPITKKHNDSIMVVIDKLTKETHFIPGKIYSQGYKYCRDFYEGNFQDAWST
jgi:hypothetical protein